MKIKQIARHKIVQYAQSTKRKDFIYNNVVSNQGEQNTKKVFDNTNGMKDEDVTKLKTEDYSKKMFKKPPKNAPQRNRKTIKLDCKATCLFNENGVCRANGITVNDLGEPVCMGYLPK